MSNPVSHASAHDSYRANYSCAQMSTPLVLPGTALVGMSVFDFDGGVSGEYVESLTLGSYEYYKTPLRSASTGSVGASTVSVDASSGTFTSTETGTSSDNPSDPTNLTDTQARRAAQISGEQIARRSCVLLHASEDLRGDREIVEAILLAAQKAGKESDVRNAKDAKDGATPADLAKERRETQTGSNVDDKEQLDEKRKLDEKSRLREKQRTT